MRRALALWGPVAAYAGLLFWLSSRSTLPAFVGNAWDKVLHTGAWTVLTALLLRALLGGWSALRVRPAILAVVLAVGYGVTDEIHQMFVPGRFPSVGDALADLAGSLTALAAWWVLARRLRPIIPGSPRRQER